MKKINKVIIFLILMLMTTNVSANTKETVTFSDCVDGDTIKVMINDKERTVRFLAVDTPETKHPEKGKEPYGEEASNYTCDRITNAKKIVLEYDENSDKEDKYDRLLAWIWVDDSLLQEELIEKGYAKVAYLYDDYKYTSNLQELEKTASSNKVGLWSNEEPTTEDDINIYLVIILLIIVVIALIFIPKYRKKTINKIKRRAKKDISKYIDKVIK